MAYSRIIFSVCVVGSLCGATGYAERVSFNSSEPLWSGYQQGRAGSTYNLGYQPREYRDFQVSLPAPPSGAVVDSWVSTDSFDTGTPSTPFSYYDPAATVPQSNWNAYGRFEVMPDQSNYYRGSPGGGYGVVPYSAQLPYSAQYRDPIAGNLSAYQYTSVPNFNVANGPFGNYGWSDGSTGGSPSASFSQFNSYSSVGNGYYSQDAGNP